MLVAHELSGCGCLCGFAFPALLPAQPLQRQELQDSPEGGGAQGYPGMGDGLLNHVMHVRSPGSETVEQPESEQAVLEQPVDDFLQVDIPYPHGELLF